MAAIPPQTDVTDDDRLWALLSWIFWPIALVAILMEEKKTRPFIKYNAIQALILGAAITVLSGVTVGFGCFIMWIPWVYGIYLGIQSYQGKWVEVPVLTNFVKGQGWL